MQTLFLNILYTGVFILHAVLVVVYGMSKSTELKRSKGANVRPLEPPREQCARPIFRSPLGNPPQGKPWGGKEKLRRNKPRATVNGCIFLRCKKISTARRAVDTLPGLKLDGASKGAATIRIKIGIEMRTIYFNISKTRND